MTHAAKITQLTAENQALAAKNQVLSAEVALLSARSEQYAQAYELLQAQIVEMRRALFGKRSERYIDPEDKQLSLLDDISNVFADAEAAGEQLATDIVVTTHTRKKKSNILQELPRRIEIIPVSDADKQCSCGACKTVIRYETKELIHYQPSVIEIVEQRREVVACAKSTCDSSIVVAPAPLQILPKTKATAEFLAFLAVSKLDDRQPFYHIERQLKERHNIDCSRQSMARWFIDLVPPLQPIYNLLKDSIIDYDVASCDATTLQVLKEPGRAATTKSYVYCFRGGTADKSVILYDYNAYEHSQFVCNWFTDFSGYLHVDADNVFNVVSNNTSLVTCNAHARRKFEPIAKASKGRGIAKEAMRYFKELYKIEREAKDKQLSPEQRYQLRQQKSKPLLEKFNTWLDEIAPTVLPNSTLGKAVVYYTKRRTDMMRFLDDGRLEVDNNLTEQEIKPLVIARKNFLFCDSVGGAKALCLHFGLIRTAKLHGLDPYHYYVMLLKHIPYCTTVAEYEKLLPWNVGRDYTPKT